MPTSCAATLGALEPARASAWAGSVEVRTADGREVGEDEPGGLRPGARRRAVHRARRAAPPPGGALAPPARPTSAGLAPLQRALLASALDAVAPGGVVGYATCSPHVAETRFVVSDVVKKRADVEVVDARPLFTDAAGQPVDGLGDGPVRAAVAARARHRRDVLRAAAAADRVTEACLARPGGRRGDRSLHHRLAGRLRHLLPDDWFERWTSRTRRAVARHPRAPPRRTASPCSTVGRVAWVAGPRADDDRAARARAVGLYVARAPRHGWPAPSPSSAGRRPAELGVRRQPRPRRSTASSASSVTASGPHETGLPGIRWSRGR